MRLRRKVKAVGGLATLLVLLGLVVADTIDAGVTLSVQDKGMLLMLIGTLLGLDKLLERGLGITIGVDSSEGGQEDE